MKKYLLLGTCLLFILHAKSQQGTLDQNFNGSGKIIYDHNGHYDIGYAVEYKPGGKIVVAGLVIPANDYDFAVLQYKMDGTLDQNFGNNGVFVIDLAGESDIATCIGFQSNKVIVGGSTKGSVDYNFALMRLNANGSLDQSFGTQGVTTLDISGVDNCRALSMLPDGKILLAGNDDKDYVVARFTANGTLDASFGSSGIARADFQQDIEYCHSMIVQKDGKIVLSGHVKKGIYNAFGTARFNTNGSKDNSFGSGGNAFADYKGTQDQTNDLCIQQDDKIVVVGYGREVTTGDIIMARFTKDGQLDQNFATGGVTGLDFEGGADQANSVALQGNGNILVAGYGDIGGEKDIVLLRYIGEFAVGTEDFIAESGGINVFPNPVSSELNIELNLDQEQSLSATMYNLEGKEMTRFFENKSFNPGSQTVIINVPNDVENGWYVLKLSDGDKFFQSRILIQK